MEINAHTKIVGLIGYPIGHTLSPVMHNTVFNKFKLNFVYLPFEVRPEELAGAIKGMRGLGIVGLNVTIPHKEEVKKYLDSLSGEAEMIGAVNCIYRTDGGLRGDNTDGRGFLRSLTERGIDLEGKCAFLIGAGGAGRACAFMLAANGIHRIILADKVTAKANALGEDLTAEFPLSSIRVISLDDNRIKDCIRGSDMVVNATPVGMRPDDGLVIDPDCLHNGMFVYDLIYNPIETPLLRAARERGAETLNGMEMLLYQGALSFELWTGKRAPIEIMWQVLEETLKG